MKAYSFYKEPLDIRNVGLNLEDRQEFKKGVTVENFYHEIILAEGKIAFSGSELGFEVFIRIFLQFSLNNFQEGYHIHVPCDPTIDISDKEIMIYKGEANLVLGGDVMIENDFYKFKMPNITDQNLYSVKDQLIIDRDGGELVVDVSHAYPSPGIQASGMSFLRIAKIFFLFNQLSSLNTFSIFKDFELIKR